MSASSRSRSRSRGRAFTHTRKIGDPAVCKYPPSYDEEQGDTRTFRRGEKVCVKFQYMPEGHGEYVRPFTDLPNDIDPFTGKLFRWISTAGKPLKHLVKWIAPDGSRSDEMIVNYNSIAKNIPYNIQPELVAIRRAIDKNLENNANSPKTRRMKERFKSFPDEILREFTKYKTNRGGSRRTRRTNARKH